MQVMARIAGILGDLEMAIRREVSPRFHGVSATDVAAIIGC